MDLMKSVISKPTPGAPKGIIYGPAGVGKTTFGARASGSLIIDCENGAGAVQCQRTPYLETWQEIETWLKEIEKGNHEYRVIAIDSVDWLVRRIEEHVSGIGSGKRYDATLNKSHGGYGNGKQVLKNYIYRCLLPLLDRIVNSGVALILLAHANRTDITDADGITVEKTTPDLPADYLNTFVEWSDFVCLVRADADGTRSMITTETNRALAKNRYSMPAVIEFTWPAFTGAISAGLAKSFK